MPLVVGNRIGPYTVVAQLGAGGMGEVYRARDSKLKREVAIKVLPTDVATDRERLARFQREAEVLASLNHPHIAHVYGIEENALVMELVEGEDLSQRIARGPMPPDEVLPIARQIAEALEAAHDAGIVHRDLKPANVKVREDGTVKVLDFGLAKAVEPVATQSSALNSPTITSPAMTMHGVILGTAAYMSPEQAKGKAVDRRADIWAFGCVLYEMLTGQRTFSGEDVSDTLVSVLRDDPRWDALPADTPPHVRQLLHRCLRRDPQKRLPHIGVARLELSGDPTPGAAAATSRQPAARPGWWTVAAAVGALLVAAPAYFLRAPLTPGVAGAGVEFSILPGPGFMFPGANNVPRFAVSPDGQKVAYQMQNEKGSQLWLRDLNNIESRPLQGTDGGAGGSQSQQPFWSPDSRYIGFFDEIAAQLKKIDLASGLVQVITAVPAVQYGGSWNDHDNIIYASVGTGGIRMVSGAGGASTAVTTVDKSKGELYHLWPEFLPDQKHFVYLLFADDTARSGVFLASTDGGTSKRLFDSVTMARVAWPDRYLFIRDGVLLSQRFDTSSFELVGDPELVANGMQATPPGRVGVSASRNGVLAYAPSLGLREQSPYEVYWVSRSGRPLAGSPPRIQVAGNGVRLSPDGRNLLFSRYTSGRGGELAVELWMQDTQRGIETRILNAPTVAGTSAFFSPDSSRVVFRQMADGRTTVRDMPVMSSLPSRPLFESPVGETVVPLDYTSDGLLVFRSPTTPSGRGLWVVPSDGRNAEPRLIAQTGEVRFGASVSPDKRWVVYAEGNEFDASQIFVQSLADPAAPKYAVSGRQSINPRWHPNGREIFYVEGNRTVVSVAFSASPRVSIGSPKPEFDLDSAILTGGPRSVSSAFDVSVDGSGFAVLRQRRAVMGAQQLVVSVNRMARH